LSLFLSNAEEMRCCMCQLFAAKAAMYDAAGLADTITTFSMYSLQLLLHAYPRGWTGQTASTSKRKVALDCSHMQPEMQKSFAS
jgi:hypothetical protein